MFYLKCDHSRQKARGFTLIELLVTLAVLAIFLGLAVPSFSSLIDQNRSDSNAYEIVSAINYARSEAVRRGESVTICASVNKTDCATAADEIGRWENGWVVLDSSNNVLSIGDLDGSASELVGANGGLVFMATGETTATRLELCSKDENGDVINITAAGQARVEREVLDCSG